jgi:NTP pyrophosphatase (non-canonical NTP hydrolase)
MTDPIDRRAPSSELLVLIQQIHDNQMLMHADQKEMDRKLTKHMTEETQELAEAIVKLQGIAFPEGDTDGHRRAHEAWINKANKSAEFYDKMKTALAQYGLLAFAGWAAYALWNSFLQGPK